MAILENEVKDEETATVYGVTAIDRDRVFSGGMSLCREDEASFLLNGAPVNNFKITHRDIEAFAYGHLVCEGYVKTVDEVEEVNIQWPAIEARTSGSPDGIYSAESRKIPLQVSNDLQGPVLSDVSVDVNTIFYCVSALDDLAMLWKQTGGTHCSAIFELSGGLVTCVEDIGRHNTIDKAVGKALLDRRDLSGCIVVTTGRIPDSMVAKVFRAGIPVLISNTAPLASGVSLARRLGMTLACFARSHQMYVYSGIERISGVERYDSDGRKE